MWQEWCDSWAIHDLSGVYKHARMCVCESIQYHAASNTRIPQHLMPPASRLSRLSRSGMTCSHQRARPRLSSTSAFVPAAHDGWTRVWIPLPVCLVCGLYFLSRMGGIVLHQRVRPRLSIMSVLLRFPRTRTLLPARLSFWEPRLRNGIRLSLPPRVRISSVLPTLNSSCPPSWHSPLVATSSVAVCVSESLSSF